MSYADYLHCTVCDCKVIYDAEVDYDTPSFGSVVALCAEHDKTHHFALAVTPATP